MIESVIDKMRTTGISFTEQWESIQALFPGEQLNDTTDAYDEFKKIVSANNVEKYVKPISENFMKKASKKLEKDIKVIFLLVNLW